MGSLILQFISFEQIAGHVLILFIFFLFGFWVWCILDILTSRFKGYEKLLWFLLVVCAPGIGTIIYLLLGRKMKVKRRTFNPF